MLHTGKDLPALTGKDIFEVRAHYREKIGVPAHGLGPTWALLAGVGILPKDSSLRTALRVGQRTPAELIDRYGVAPGPVRDLLVRYLTERKSSVDYTTIKSLAHMAGGTSEEAQDRRNRPWPLPRCRRLGRPRSRRARRNLRAGRVRDHQRCAADSRRLD